MNRLTLPTLPQINRGGGGRKGGEKKHSLLLQRIQVWFVAPTVSLKLSGAVTLVLWNPADLCSPKVGTHMIHLKCEGTHKHKGWQGGPWVKITVVQAL